MEKENGSPRAYRTVSCDNKMNELKNAHTRKKLLSGNCDWKFPKHEGFLRYKARKKRKIYSPYPVTNINTTRHYQRQENDLLQSQSAARCNQKPNGFPRAEELSSWGCLPLDTTHFLLDPLKHSQSLILLLNELTNVKKQKTNKELK